ncbi:hypothetical protein NKG05_25625 [Oerskovia sp. M15]
MFNYKLPGSCNSVSVATANRQPINGDRGNMKRIIGAVVALALSLSLTSLVATSASAEPPSADETGSAVQALTLTPEESVALAHELDLTAKSSTLTVGDVERTTYTLDTGSTIVLEKPVPTPGQITPAWSVGVGWGSTSTSTRATSVYWQRVGQPDSQSSSARPRQ